MIGELRTEKQSYGIMGQGKLVFLIQYRERKKKKIQGKK